MAVLAASLALVGCGGGDETAAVVSYEQMLACIGDVLGPEVFVRTDATDLDEAGRTAGQGGAKVEWGAGGAAYIAVERSVADAEQTLDRYVATIRPTEEFQGTFRRYGNVVVRYTSTNPGRHQAGIVRCATQGG